jgi:hypothetical protein
MRRSSLLLAVPALFLPFFLGACDQLGSKLGIEDPAKKEARLDAEGKAVGGGCRHSGRAIEDCYAIYTWLPKESIFAGWRDMDEYMRTNNIDTVAPQLPPPPPPGSKRKTAADGADKAVPAGNAAASGAGAAAEKPADKADKPGETAPAAKAAAGHS